MNLEEVRSEARKKLKGICGVYRICDGADSRICQGQSYGRSLGIGGIGSGVSFSNNIKALERIKLRMRTVGAHFETDTGHDFFGKQLTMPVMGASVSGVNSFGGDSVLTEDELCHAIVKGCQDAGSLGWRGDTYTYSLENPCGINAIKECGGWGVKIVKPRDQETIKDFFKLAEEAGAVAVGVDVDGFGSFMMTKNNQPVYRKSRVDIEDLVSATELPVILKGIMCVEDALAAVDAGASAIVVSNHGGRVLDCTPGTAEVLPEITSTVGNKVKVIADGGVRTGYDILKMLALGAEAVLVGRDIIRAAVGGGANGVKLQMDYLGKTLGKAMKMTGCSTLKDINPSIIYS